MTKKKESPCEINCYQYDRLNGDCEDSETYYQVPFVYGSEQRVAKEWHCESCIKKSPMYVKDGDEVFLSDLKGNGTKVAEAQDVLDNPEIIRK